jgi:hypothetical protein
MANRKGKCKGEIERGNEKRKREGNRKKIKQGFRKGKRNYKWYMKMETERGNVL